MGGAKHARAPKEAHGAPETAEQPIVPFDYLCKNSLVTVHGMFEER